MSNLREIVKKTLINLDANEDSVKKTDELLYEAKQNPRNKIIFEDGKEF